jgi:hypothetical protein
MYVPYRMRLILFNRHIYGYSFLSSLAHFLSLQNISATLLFANIYPLGLGLYLAYKNKNYLPNYICLSGLLLAIIVVGLNTSPEKFNSLFPTVPLIFYITLSGLQKVNLKLYAVLFILSLMLTFSPIR